MRRDLGERRLRLSRRRPAGDEKDAQDLRKMLEFLGVAVPAKLRHAPRPPRRKKSLLHWLRRKKNKVLPLSLIHIFEPDTLPLLRLLLEKEKSVAVPLCTGPGQMEARRIPSLEALRTGRWGIMEPRENSLLIDPSSIAFALVPCLCCDLQGRRLGQDVYKRQVWNHMKEVISYVTRYEAHFRVEMEQKFRLQSEETIRVYKKRLAQAEKRIGCLLYTSDGC